MTNKNRSKRETIQMPLRMIPSEWQILEDYSKAVGRSKNDILRDFVRTLNLEKLKEGGRN